MNTSDHLGGFYITVFHLCIVSYLKAKSNDGGESAWVIRLKRDRSKSGLGSSQVEGQGTTTHETGSIKVPSSNKKQKRILKQNWTIPGAVQLIISLMDVSTLFSADIGRTYHRMF